VTLLFLSAKLGKIKEKTKQNHFIFKKQDIIGKNLVPLHGRKKIKR
jgi:hypothetical protein